MEQLKMASAAISVVSLLLGVFLTEFLRRLNRAEAYSSQIFERRLSAYEKLMNLVNDGSSVAHEVIENRELDADQRRKLISAAIMPIAEHVDRNFLYVDQDLGAHCCALFMGVEDIQEAQGDERKKLIDAYFSMLRENRRMIYEDSGASKVNSIFKRISRSGLESPIINRLRELRKETKGTT